MNKKIFPFPFLKERYLPIQKKRGVVLVVVLSFLALLSMVILSYFSDTLKISRASSHYTTNLLTDIAVSNHTRSVISMIQKRIEERSTKVFSAEVSKAKENLNSFKFLPTTNEDYRVMKGQTSHDLRWAMNDEKGLKVDESFSQEDEGS